MEYAIVYTEKDFSPREVKRLARHHCVKHREKEDWCNAEMSKHNEVVAGSVEQILALETEIEIAAQNNRVEYSKAQRLKGRPGAAEKILNAPVEPPWKANAQKGQLRGYVITAHHEYFESAPGFRDPQKVSEFKRAAIAFMKKKCAPDDILYAVWEEDERAPHLHVYARHWKTSNSKNRGRQELLQATDMQLSKNPERAQDAAGKWFAALGLKRGQRHAEERRQARKNGEPVPPKPKHTSVREWAERTARERIREQEEAELRAKAAAAEADRRRRKADAAEKAAMKAEARAQEAQARAEEEKRKMVECAKKRMELDREAYEKRRRDREKKHREMIEKERARLWRERQELDADRRELQQKTGLLVEMLQQFSVFAEHVKAAARSVGMQDHYLVQTAERAAVRMRDMVGKLGGWERTR